MAQATTLQLLPQTVYGSNVVGEPQKAAAYYLGNKNLQTVTWSFTTVKATMIIEASLANNPTSDDDWFVVYTLATGNNTLTQNGFTNIEGNFVWLRARVNPFDAGVIQYVKVTY